MKIRSLILTLLIVILTASCGPSQPPTGVTPQTTVIYVVVTATLPALPARTPTSSAPPAEALPSTPPPTHTPVETLQPTLTPTPIQGTPRVTAGANAVNCRTGPGTGYVSVAALMPGNPVPILGRDASGSWWQIQDPSDAKQMCWVAASVTSTSGDTGGVPVAAAPQSLVLSVSMVTKPGLVTTPVCISPIPNIKLKGSIYASGPVKIRWHFETQLSGGLGEQSLRFNSYGALDVSEIYVPPPVAGTYWLRLIIDSPNQVVSETTYTLVCTPPTPTSTPTP